MGGSPSRVARTRARARDARRGGLGCGQTPGPLRAFYERIRSRRGMQIAVVTTARKLAVLCWHLVTKDEDCAFGRPSLTEQKLRKLELRAGMPSRKGRKGRSAAYHLWKSAGANASSPSRQSTRTDNSSPTGKRRTGEGEAGRGRRQWDAPIKAPLRGKLRGRPRSQNLRFAPGSTTPTRKRNAPLTALGSEVAVVTPTAVERSPLARPRRNRIPGYVTPPEVQRRRPPSAQLAHIDVRFGGSAKVWASLVVSFAAPVRIQDVQPRRVVLQRGGQPRRVSECASSSSFVRAEPRASPAKTAVWILSATAVGSLTRLLGSETPRRRG